MGALEQHGPHLPLGANVLIAHRVVEAVSRVTGILHAPPFSYGVTGGGGPWAGSAGLRRKTFHRAVNELLARWEDHGVQDFFIVTAHRYEPHVEALLLSLTAKSSTTVFDLHQLDVSDLVEGNPRDEHAGELETSVLLHLHPEWVRAAETIDFAPEDKDRRKYTRGRLPTPPQESRGTLGRPALATAEKGAVVFQRWVAILSHTLRPTPDANTPGAEG